MERSLSNVFSRRPLIEAVEPRRMFAVVNVAGTAGADDINVYVSGANVIVENNGVTSSYTSVTGIVISGGSGADLITVQSSFSRPATIGGDSGDDTLQGGSGPDQINGGNNNDDIYGVAGNDTINGNSGDDYIIGGTGSDFVYGGTGADTLDGNNSLGGSDGVIDRIFGNDAAGTSDGATDIYGLGDTSHDIFTPD